VISKFLWLPLNLYREEDLADFRNKDVHSIGKWLEYVSINQEYGYQDWQNKSWAREVEKVEVT
jgi:hypothetical protein